MRKLFSLPILLVLFSCQSKKQYKDWKVFGGSKENIHYSTLTQIDTANVTQLQVAWMYHTGDADTANHSQIQCNPIVVDGILYGTSPQLKLFAIDAATGKPKWVFNPYDTSQKKSAETFIMNNNRGVTYWEDGNDKRIFFAAGSYLFAIDAVTGKIIEGFGKEGKIDLHDGLERDVNDLYVAATSPGIIYRDMIIMGSRVSEGGDAAPGYIRAYDVHTGKIRWVFHTIPQPGEFGYDTWKDTVAWKHIGGANCWSGFALDEKRGILFAPIGSASFDFYGGKRKGNGLFADCLLAIDAGTGKYKWHFQDVHHDTWDKDFPTPPALVSVMHEGKLVDAVAQPTKTGFVFLLDRETGKPLFPIEEKRVPHNSEIEGEELSATQPFPTLPKSFMRQTLTENDLNNLLPDSSYQDIKKRFATYKSGNVFQPISKEGTIVFPGLDGGAEWGGSGFDPETGLLYVNANEIPWVITLTDVKNAVPKKENLLQAGIRLYNSNCMTCHGPDRKGSGNYPSLLEVNKKYNEQDFLNVVSTGRRMMPAFKQLSEEEKSAIASFILNIKSSQQKTFVEAPKPVDTFLNLPYTITGYNKFVSKEGYPANMPPWGTLNAVNLVTGEIDWRDTLGDYPEFKKKGIHTGTENYGGPVVTAGGLLFIAATSDGKLRAFNKRSGKLLWETELPAAGFATPSVYELNGKEYLVIACGGGKLHAQSGDAYVAFALPAK
ncbi:MAG: PQQ-binding-like beta-propeller repeat protein [Bacteroidetes bacterium]|nr:PQQ-binding-like beta-propeller repeat protein [Bacteroidota bacterium]